VSSDKLGCVLKKVGEKLRYVVLHYNTAPEQWQSDLVHCRHLVRLHLMCLEACKPDVWDILRANRDLETLEISLILFPNETFSKTVPTLRKLVLPKLRTLKLHAHSRGSHFFVGAMKLCNQLVCLDLQGCRMKPAVLLQIPRLCPGLKCLGLASVDLTDEILNKIAASCPNIIHLNIADNFQITDVGVRNMVQNLASLQSLCIQNVPLLTEASLTCIQTCCAKTLHTLYLGSANEFGGQLFTRRAINGLLEQCAQLRTFSWQQPFRRNGDVFPLSTSALRHLSVLHLSGLDIYTLNLAESALHAQHLTSLVIQYEPRCPAVSDGELHQKFKSICLGCPLLRELYIVRRYEELPKSVVEDLQDGAPNLAVHVHYPYHKKYEVTDMI